jgi:hypothetical protein
MKALENLGKISSVGLFSDKIEISVQNRSIDTIERDLQKTLEMYMGAAVEIPGKPVVKSIADIDLDEELGRVKDKDEPGTT